MQGNRDDRSPVQWDEEPAQSATGQLRKITFSITIPRLTNELQAHLQTVMDLVRLVLAGVAKTPAGRDDPFRESFVYLDPAQNRKLPPEELRVEARQWILRSAFRDAVEALAPLLEETRRILALWSLKGLTKGSDYNRRVEEEGAKFHRWGPLVKIRFLGAEYGFEVRDDWQDIVASIVRARNCIVHRDALVGSPDVGTNGEITVKWVGFGPFVRRDEALHPIGPRDVLTEGEFLVLARHPVTKTFKLGERLEFSAKDFTDICYTLIQFGRLLKPTLDAYRKDRGIP